jgi:hypothetical protein
MKRREKGGASALMPIIGTVPKHQLVRHLCPVRCAIEGRSLGYFCIVHEQYPRSVSPLASVCVCVCACVCAPGICVCVCMCVCMDVCTHGFCTHAVHTTYILTLTPPSPSPGSLDLLRECGCCCHHNRGPRTCVLTLNRGKSTPPTRQSSCTAGKPPY